MRSIAKRILDEFLNLFLIVSLIIFFNVFFIVLDWNFDYLFWDWEKVRIRDEFWFDRKLNCTNPV